MSPNVPGSLVEMIREVIGVGMVEEHSKYLGLPSSISHNKMDIFFPICEKIRSVVAGRKDKLLSTVGRRC